MKRLISGLLTITMLLGITASVPLTASAVAVDKVESGDMYGDVYTDKYGSWTYEKAYLGEGYRITGYDESMSEIVYQAL